MATGKRLKVLVSAYACSPYQGSEAGVGWGFVRAMSRRHDLWVIVEEDKFRDDIHRYLSTDPQLTRSVQFFFIRKRRNRWLRKIWPPSYYWYYRDWHRDAFELGRRLHAEIRFDLAHQLTMVGFREPGLLWHLGIPFVWGPIGGMGLFPWRFLTEVGPRGAVYYLAYNLYNLAHMRWLRQPRLAARAAGAGLISATPDTRASALRYWGCPSEIMCEVGLPPARATAPRARGVGATLSLMWSGQHVHRKALNLALRAVAKLPRDIAWTLDVLGHGPLTAQWRRLARDLGIDDRCRFHGWMERSRALEVMSAGHVLLITSLRELTSTVTLEALALGLPVVCLDHCGFADAINDTCGIKVPVNHPSQLVDGLSDAIVRLARNEGYRMALAKGALQRARAYDWQAKADQLDGIYRAVVDDRSPADDDVATNAGP